MEKTPSFIATIASMIGVSSSFGLPTSIIFIDKKTKILIIAPR